MKIKTLFIFTLIFSSSPLCAMYHPSKLDAELANAVKAGNIKEIESCLIRGANPDTRIDDWGMPTSLIFATSNGYIKMVRLFLDHHADVNATDNELCTALHHAALWGQSTIINILLKNGANINLKDEDGRTSLRWAGSDTIEPFLKHINHTLDRTDDPQIHHQWDFLIFNTLDKEWPFGIKIINAFHMLLHHASKLPLSTKKLNSLSAQALREDSHGESSFRKTIEHLRTQAF
ncbi:MAG: hypothetical protein US13_C0010G0019 [candidate division TM6 bacterium GW2011_GWE2_36_25]|nr:MAG: hypothetical protein US13_C0010G0019 [candidate division TM6 bacterium GW2011_GWE2_36_25]KKQ19144.1 MAG: hypothetical protein US32_C0015G0027 [candidate division TM6 bacterium GW2011_GWA2_36_9]